MKCSWQTVPEAKHVCSGPQQPPPPQLLFSDHTLVSQHVLFSSVYVATSLHDFRVGQCTPRDA